jgi:predicted DNA-binding protein
MYHGDMRTTIELKPEHRARLLAIAANRGEKGFSSVIAEAIGHYLEAEPGRSTAKQRALQLMGTLSPKEAEQLRRRTAAIRAFWR